MEANKLAIPNLNQYFNIANCTISKERYNLLKMLAFMIIDEEEQDVFAHFGYPIQISVYAIEEDRLFCRLEDISNLE
jgi:hypothetical protein